MTTAPEEIRLTFGVRAKSRSLGKVPPSSIQGVTMPGFVQVIEMRTHRSTVDKLEKDWLAGTEGKRTIRRQIVIRDRSDSTRYLIFAFRISTSSPTTTFRRTRSG